MLKFQYKDLDSIPEGLEEYYTEQDDGTYQLKVEGAVDKKRLDEFRDNNKKLMSDLEQTKDRYSSLEHQYSALDSEVKEKYSGIDLEAYNEMLAKQKALKEKKLIEAGKHEELLKMREDELRNEFSSIMSKQNEALSSTEAAYQSKLQGLEGKLSKLLIDNQLTALAAQYGVLPTAIDDVLARGKGSWRIEEGQPVAYDGQGNRMYSSDGTTPLDMNTWMESLSTNAPHLFEASSGSGEDFNLDSLFGDDSTDNNTPDYADEPGQEYMVGPLASIREGLEKL